MKIPNTKFQIPNDGSSQQVESLSIKILKVYNSGLNRKLVIGNCNLSGAR